MIDWLKLAQSAADAQRGSVRSKWDVVETLSPWMDGAMEITVRLEKRIHRYHKIFKFCIQKYQQQCSRSLSASSQQQA